MNLFDFHPPEWIFVMINFGILVFFLTKFLWKPVNKILDERRSVVDKTFEDARAVETDRKAMDERLAALEDDLDSRTKEMMKEARTRAGHEYDRIVQEAESKAKQIVSAARVQAEHDRDSMIYAAQTEIITTTIEMAGLLIEANMDNAQNERLLKSFLSRKDVSA